MEIECRGCGASAGVCSGSIRATHQEASIEAPQHFFISIHFSRPEGAAGGQSTDKAHSQSQSQKKSKLVCCSNRLII